MATLQFERGAAEGSAGGLVGRAASRSRAWSGSRAALERDGRPVLDDPVVRDRLAQFWLEETALRANARARARPGPRRGSARGAAAACRSSRARSTARRWRTSPASCSGRRRGAVDRRSARAGERGVAALVPELVRDDDRGRHQRDPAQHPGRARARPAEDAMNTPIRYDEEHALLRAEARRWLDERFPIARVRALADGDSGEDPADWKELAALGWLGPVRAREVRRRGPGRRTPGGVDGGDGPAAAALPAPARRPWRRWRSRRAASEAQRERWLRPLVARRGAARAGAAAATRSGAASARTRSSRGVGERFAIVERRAAGRRGSSRELVLDRTRRSARVTLDGRRARGRRVPARAAAEVLAQLTPWACLALAAEMAGGADALLAHDRRPTPPRASSSASRSARSRR